MASTRSPRAGAPTRRRRGRVVWITGLAGSGKTTVARLLCARLGRAGLAPILLDGNELRRTIARDLGYDAVDRRQCAERYARLSRLLARQGHVVVVATISMFEDVRCWHRRGTPGYVEVFLRIPAETRHVRVRGRRASGRAGVDMAGPYEEPRRPDLIVEDPTLSAAEVMERIWRRIEPHASKT